MCSVNTKDTEPASLNGREIIDEDNIENTIFTLQLEFFDDRLISLAKALVSEKNASLLLSKINDIQTQLTQEECLKLIDDLCFSKIKDNKLLIDLRTNGEWALYDFFLLFNFHQRYNNLFITHELGVRAQLLGQDDTCIKVFEEQIKNGVEDTTGALLATASVFKLKKYELLEIFYTVLSSGPNDDIRFPLMRCLSSLLLNKTEEAEKIYSDVLHNSKEEMPNWFTSIFIDKWPDIVEKVINSHHIQRLNTLIKVSNILHWNLDKVIQPIKKLDAFSSEICNFTEYLPFQNIHHWIVELELQHPRPPKINQLLLTLYMELGQINDVIRILKEIDGPSEKTIVYIEKLFHAVQGNKKSRDLLEYSLIQFPYSVKLIELISNITFDAGHYNLILDRHNSLPTVVKDQLSLDYTKNYVKACEYSNDIKTAITAAKRVLKASPSDTELIRLAAKYEFSLTNYENALNYIEDIIELETPSDEVYELASYIARSSGDLNLSNIYIYKIIEKGRNLNNININLLNIFMQNTLLLQEKKWTDLTIELINLCYKGPKSGWGEKLFFANYLLVSGKLDNANTVISSLVEKSPTSEAAIFFQAICLLASNENQTATNLLIDYEPTNSGLVAEWHYLTAIAASRINDIKLVSKSLNDILIHKGPDYYFQSLQLNEDEQSFYSNKCEDNVLKQLKDSKYQISSHSLGQHLILPEECSKPIVSIIVYSQNDAKFISDCLFSMSMQCFPFWECIIIDDNSSDASYEIAKKYTLIDNRFKLFKNTATLGMAASLNCGLDFSSGEYLTFIKGKDYLHQTSLLIRYQTISNQKNDGVIGSYCGIQNTSKDNFGDMPLKPNKANMNYKNLSEVKRDISFKNFSPLVRKNFFTQNSLKFDEKIHGELCLWHLWLHITQLGHSFAPSGIIGQVNRDTYLDKKYVLSQAYRLDMHKLRQKVYLSDHSQLEQPHMIWSYPLLKSFFTATILAAVNSYMLNLKDSFEHILSELLGDMVFYENLGINIKICVQNEVNSQLKECKIEKQNFKNKLVSLIADRIENHINTACPNQTPKLVSELLNQTDHIKHNKIKPITARPAIITPKHNEEDYRYPIDTSALQKYHNIHSGERCFIVGNGPSLNNTEMHLLNNETSFAVNGIFYLTEMMGYKPTYYMVEDTSVMKENIADIISYDVPHKFFPSIYTNLHPTDKNVHFFKMNRGFYEPRSPNYCIPRFSTDFSERAYCGQSVTFINLQLAYYMGFQEVYLVGMDFNYEIPTAFERKGDIITSTHSDPNHFHPDYFGTGKTWKNPKLDRVLNNYRMAKLVYESAGRKIYNATVGGKLELFEKVDFNALF